jgi:hypothetical protein
MFSIVPLVQPLTAILATSVKVPHARILYPIVINLPDKLIPYEGGTFTPKVRIILKWTLKKYCIEDMASTHLDFCLVGYNV